MIVALNFYTHLSRIPFNASAFSLEKNEVLYAVMVYGNDYDFTGGLLPSIEIQNNSFLPCSYQKAGPNLLLGH